jgi:HlyD family secretion protein
MVFAMIMYGVRNMKVNFSVAAFVLPFFAAISGAMTSGCASKTGGPVYEFTVISRGSLEKTVSSTGTLNPVATVKVLPRMSGKVEKIHVDFNAPVRGGEILAELNTDMLRLQREQQMASVIKARANYDLQQLNYQNQVKLAEKNLISDYELKTGKTSLDIQVAELAASEASFKAIETEINQYAFITSPIDGIVLERNINVGDTVVDSSSSNSSAIFTLAENLEEMQIESWVGELDIASITEGQPVRFTLESLPGRTYQGEVQSKRLMPSVQDNVVSYKVIISVENPDGSLLPGMTCSVEFIQERRENILLAPNAVLRFQPSALSAGEISDLVFNAGLAGMDEARREAAVTARAEAQKEAAQARGNSQAGLAGLFMPGGRMMRGPGGGGNRNAGAGELPPSPPKPLWYLDSGGRPACLLVRAGVSDGIHTEIDPFLEGEDLERLNVILRERVQP